jgi:hypothetical protein
MMLGMLIWEEWDELVDGQFDVRLFAWVFRGRKSREKQNNAGERLPNRYPSINRTMICNGFCFSVLRRFSWCQITQLAVILPPIKKLSYEKYI